MKNGGWENAWWRVEDDGQVDVYGVLRTYLHTPFTVMYLDRAIVLQYSTVQSIVGYLEPLPRLGPHIAIDCDSMLHTTHRGFSPGSTLSITCMSSHVSQSEALPLCLPSTTRILNQRCQHETHLPPPTSVIIRTLYRCSCERK